MPQRFYTEKSICRFIMVTSTSANVDILTNRTYLWGGVVEDMWS